MPDQREAPGGANHPEADNPTVTINLSGPWPEKKAFVAAKLAWAAWIGKERTEKLSRDSKAYLGFLLHRLKYDITTGRAIAAVPNDETCDEFDSSPTKLKEMRAEITASLWGVFWQPNGRSVQHFEIRDNPDRREKLTELLAGKRLAREYRRNLLKGSGKRAPREEDGAGIPAPQREDQGAGNSTPRMKHGAGNAAPRQQAIQGAGKSAPKGAESRPLRGLNPGSYYRESFPDSAFEESVRRDDTCVRPPAREQVDPVERSATSDIIVPAAPDMFTADRAVVEILRGHRLRIDALGPRMGAWRDRLIARGLTAADVADLCAEAAGRGRVP